jgi:hypothetical protein
LPLDRKVASLPCGILQKSSLDKGQYRCLLNIALNSDSDSRQVRIVDSSQLDAHWPRTRPRFQPDPAKPPRIRRCQRRGTFLLIISIHFADFTFRKVYIWDLKDPSKPYTPTPGSRSTKLDEITSVAWNQQVQYVLAGSSSTGYTVVWDLRGKREVVALAYGGGAGTLAGQVAAGGGLAVGGRRGMSDIAWHPDNVRVLSSS